MPVRKSDYPLCRHTKTNGLQCKSPALTTSAFCYHHQKMRRTRWTTISSGPGLSTNVLHPLRHADSLQQALAMVISGLAAGRIHRKQAGQMIYGIQIAISNLRKGSLE
jgi:hydrogenase/urease accessory protein HupE